MNLAGHLGILSAKNSTDQTWRGTRRGEKEVVELACGAAKIVWPCRCICFEFDHDHLDQWANGIESALPGN